MADTMKFYCAGEWRKSTEAFDVTSPYDGSVSARIYQAGEKDVEDATAGALDAFGETRKMPAWKREEILLNICNGLTENVEELAKAICSENGKPLTDARVEASRAATVFKIAAEETKRIGGEYLPMDLAPGAEGRYAIYKRFALGPVFGITPFNFPLNLACHKIAPALASGDTIVIKPASSTPISSLLLARICEEAGVPRGALSVLPTTVPMAEKMVGDDRFKLVTFTGSPAVGWALKAKAGMKKVALELGGNAGVIVHRDADVAHAAARCVTGAFAIAGQICISLQRVYAHKDIFDELASEIVRLTEKLKVGDPSLDTTQVGPMINEREAQRALGWIKEATSSGARILCGGVVEGATLKPTVLTEAASDMKVSCAEIFAPVVTLTPYDDVNDAIRMVDESEFGLQAGLFTNDLRVIDKAYQDIEVGGLMINEIPTWRLDHMPYGGVKNSGFGREGLKYAIEEMTEGKLIVYAGSGGE